MNGGPDRRGGVVEFFTGADEFGLCEPGDEGGDIALVYAVGTAKVGLAILPMRALDGAPPCS
jgi:hypothetical protein